MVHRAGSTPAVLSTQKAHLLWAYPLVVKQAKNESPMVEIRFVVWVVRFEIVVSWK